MWHWSKYYVTHCVYARPTKTISEFYLVTIIALRAKGCVVVEVQLICADCLLNCLPLVAGWWVGCRECFCWLSGWHGWVWLCVSSVFIIASDDELCVIFNCAVLSTMKMCWWPDWNWRYLLAQYSGGVLFEQTPKGFCFPMICFPMKQFWTSDYYLRHSGSNDPWRALNGY